jgi:hypothetical protein
MQAKVYSTSHIDNGCAGVTAPQEHFSTIARLSTAAEFCRQTGLLGVALCISSDLTAQYDSSKGPTIQFHGLPVHSSHATSIFETGRVHSRERDKILQHVAAGLA